MRRLAVLCVFTALLDCSMQEDCKALDLSCSPIGVFLYQRIAYPRFLYSGNLGATTVTAYTFDYLTGSIVPAGSVGAAPGSIFVDPAGQILYAANGGLNTITSFFVNQTTGVLTSASSTPAAGPGGIVIDSAGTYLYALNNTSNLVETYRLNSQTGSASFVSSTASGTGSNWLTMHPNGLALYVANSTAGNVSSFAVNPITGSVTLTGQAALAVARGVAVDPFGRFVYATDNTSSLKVLRINGDGSLTQISTVATGVFNTFVTTTPDARFVYTTNQTSNDVSVLSVDGSGVLTNVANRAAGTGPIGIGIDPLGKFLVVGNAGAGTVMVYSINRFTGDITPVDVEPAGIGAQSVAFSNRSAF